jgi:hypothetical protein
VHLLLLFLLLGIMLLWLLLLLPCHPQVLCEELGISDVGEVFEWINLDTPIGSASISQVRAPGAQVFATAESPYVVCAVCTQHTLL